MADSLSDFETAVAAYRELCDRNSLTFHQPVEEYSTVVHNLVYLRTAPAGFVARYSLRRRTLLI